MCLCVVLHFVEVWCIILQRTNLIAGIPLCRISQKCFLMLELCHFFLTYLFPHVWYMLLHFGAYSCNGTQEKLVGVRENNDKIKKHWSIKAPDTPLCMKNYPDIPASICIDANFHSRTYLCYGSKEEISGTRENNDEIKKQLPVNIKKGERNTQYTTLHKQWPWAVSERTISYTCVGLANTRDNKATVWMHRI